MMISNITSLIIIFLVVGLLASQLDYILLINYHGAKKDAFGAQGNIFL